MKAYTVLEGFRNPQANVVTKCTLQAWCRKAEWKPRRTASLPRKPNAMLDTPPLILQPGHTRFSSRVALQPGRQLGGLGAVRQ